MTLPPLHPSSLSAKLPPLVFTHFSSDKVADLLGEVCRLLGCHGDLMVVVDYIMDECHAHPHLCCEHLLLLSQVIAGGGHKGCGHHQTPPTNVPKGVLFSLIEGVLTRLVAYHLWPHGNHGHASLNSDLYTYLLVNTIFTCVHVLGVDFDPLLQQLLYPLMQHLGSRNVGVADAAMATLEAICTYCGYE